MSSTHLSFRARHPDTEIVVDVMLGSTNISVGEFLKLTEGDIISLHKPAGSGGEIYVNSRIIGTGDIIVIDETASGDRYQPDVFRPFCGSV